MSRRITGTFREHEVELIEQLRDIFSPGQALSSFMADCLMAAVEAEMHGIKCQCNEMASMLYEWRPEGRPN